MTQGPPETPPEKDSRTPLTKRYPPHGFPAYLGLGLLDRDSLKLEPGLSVAEYRNGDDLVCRVTGTYDPAITAEGSSACGAEEADWTIEEFHEGDLGIARPATRPFHRPSTITSRPNCRRRTLGSEIYSCGSRSSTRPRIGSDTRLRTSCFRPGTSTWFGY